MEGGELLVSPDAPWRLRAKVALNMTGRINLRFVMFQRYAAGHSPSRRLTLAQYLEEIRFILRAPCPALYFRMVPQVVPPASL